jgi:hypothetical protein
MAYKRDDFKNKIESHLTGAIVEHYKATLAKKNGQTKWVSHWEGEVNRLIGSELVVAILHPIRGFKDRSKAFAEAVTEIKESDRSYRRYAENTVKRDYGLRRLKQGLEAVDTANFWKRVNVIAEDALQATR